MIWIFIVACFTVPRVQCQNNSTLRLVEMLFRHGDISPTILYPNDPNPASIWREGLGRLTMLGRKQQYVLGRFLRSMYENFVTSNPNEVAVDSADPDMCLRSAECLVAGFYAPTPDWTFDDRIPWQPIPVRWISQRVDKYLNLESDCPAAYKDWMRISDGPSCRQLLKEHKDMLKILSARSGKEFKTIFDVDDFRDTLYVEKKYNLIIPTWVDPYWDELSDFSRKSLSCNFPTHLFQRLRAGPLLERIITDMKMKVSGNLPDLKVRIYSAHEHNLKIVLSALKLFNMQRPPYSATVIFELHEMDEGQNAVRLLYLNSSTPEHGFQVPNVLTLKGCSEYCPLEHFITYTKDLIPDNWEKECGLKKKALNRNYWDIAYERLQQ